MFVSVGRFSARRAQNLHSLGSSLFQMAEYPGILVIRANPGLIL